MKIKEQKTKFALFSVLLLAFDQNMSANKG